MYADGLLLYYFNYIFEHERATILSGVCYGCPSVDKTGTGRGGQPCKAPRCYFGRADCIPLLPTDALTK